MFKKTSHKSSIKIQTALVASQPLTTMTPSNLFKIENKESTASIHKTKTEIKTKKQKNFCTFKAIYTRKIIIKLAQ